MSNLSLAGFQRSEYLSTPQCGPRGERHGCVSIASGARSDERSQGPDEYEEVSKQEDIEDHEIWFPSSEVEAKAN